MVSCYLDSVAFAASAAFMALLRPVIDGPAGWSGAWGLLAATGAASLGLNAWFLQKLFASTLRAERRPPPRPGDTEDSPLTTGGAGNVASDDEDEARQLQPLRS